MKHYFLLMIFCSASAFAEITALRYQTLTLSQKKEVIEAYQDFFREDLVPLMVSNEKKIFTQGLLEAAWASSNYDCFFAGWPSVKRVIHGRSFCGSPKGSNSDYDQGPCGPDELQCEVHLFNPGLCFKISTQALRNRAFSQCEEKFKAAGRKIEDIALKLSGASMTQQLEDLFRTVDHVCKAHSSPSICKRLETRVKEIVDSGPKRKPLRSVMPVTKMTEKDVVKTLGTSYSKLTRAIKNPSPDCDDTSSPSVSKIKTLTSSPGNLNCPTPVQVKGLKAMIFKNALTIASLLCENEWGQLPSVKNFLLKRSDVFSGDLSKRDVALSLYNLFSNRLFKEGLQDSYLSYYRGVFGPKQHVDDTVGVMMVNSLHEKVKNQQLSCAELGESMIAALSSSDGEFAAAVEKASVANQPELWDMALAQVRKEKGLGDCHLFDTKKD